MSGATHPLPNTPSWRGAQLKHGGNSSFTFTFTFTFTCSARQPDASNCGRYNVNIWSKTSMNWSSKRYHSKGIDDVIQIYSEICVYPLRSNIQQYNTELLSLLNMQIE